MKKAASKNLLRKKITQKDLAWVNWTPAFIKKRAREIIIAELTDHEVLKSIPKNERTFQNTIIGEDDKGRGDEINIFALLKNVSPKKPVREAAAEALVEISQKLTHLSYDIEMYHAIKEYRPAYAAKHHGEILNDAEKKMHKDVLKGLKRMGFHLSDKVRASIVSNNKKLSKFESAFKANIAEYHDELLCTREELVGLPESYLDGLEKKKDKYVVTMSYPDTGPVFRLAQNSKVRKTLADKFSMRGGKKNLTLLKKIVELRHENAKLLGYKSHAEYVLEDRMAKSPKKVMDFIKKLKSVTKDIAKQEDKDIEIFKKNYEDTKEGLTYYDSGYYVNLLREELFDIDTEKVREYFPTEHVIDQMFVLFDKVFGLSIKRVERDLWHNDVQVVEVSDKKSKGLLGYIALDLYPRKGKYTHAMAMTAIKARKINSTEYQAPLSLMVANVAAATKSRPSLMTHNDVTTFFHEMGHLIHNTITTAQYASQAGFNTIMDFVELPSQMFEGWCWQPGYLKTLTSHFETGKSMPKEMVSNLVRTRFFLEASGTMGQLSLAELDMGIHTKPPTIPLNEYEQKIKKQYGITRVSPKSLRPASFGHVAGSYDAGYYSYMWALVFAYDCFGEFEKEGVMSAKIGKKFRKEILEVGSSRDEMTSLKAFLGRTPKLKAFTDKLKLGLDLG